MATNRRRAAAPGLAAIEMSTPLPEHCNCPPLSLLHERRTAHQEDEDEDNERLVPATQFLNDRMRASLDDYFPRVAPLSIVLLHVSQHEHIHSAPQAALAFKRRRYHAPPGLLAQILVNVRRAIRADDKMLIHEDSGAALILPDVDRWGVRYIGAHLSQRRSPASGDGDPAPDTRNDDPDGQRQLPGARGIAGAPSLLCRLRGAQSHAAPGAAATADASCSARDCPASHL